MYFSGRALQQRKEVELPEIGTRGESEVEGLDCHPGFAPKLSGKVRTSPLLCYAEDHYIVDGNVYNYGLQCCCLPGRALLLEQTNESCRGIDLRPCNYPSARHRGPAQRVLLVLLLLLRLLRSWGAEGVLGFIRKEKSLTCVCNITAMLRRRVGRTVTANIYMKTGRWTRFLCVYR